MLGEKKRRERVQVAEKESNYDRLTCALRAQDRQPDKYISYQICKLLWSCAGGWAD